MPSPAKFPHLLALYLLSTSFTKLFHTGDRVYLIQLPELIFLLLVAMLLWRHAYRLHPPSTFDKAFIVLWLSQVLAAAVQPGFWSNKSLYILSYLLLFYHLGTAMLRASGTDIVALLRSSVQLLGWILLGNVAISRLYHYSYPEGALELVELKEMPFIGWVPRVEALTMSPNMLMNLLMLPFFVLLGEALYHRRVSLLLGLLSLGMLATFSKSILLAGVGVLLLLALRYTSGKLRVALASSAFVLALVFVTLSKVLFLPSGQALTSEESYHTGELLFTAGSASAYKTMHLWLNEEALRLFRQSPLLGIGPGRFTAHIDELKAAGQFPLDKLSFAPHSLYFGMLAQSGLLGFLALLGLVLALLRLMWHTWQRAPPVHRGVVAGLCTYLFIWLLDGISMDTLHFRHFWWAVIMLASLQASYGAGGIDKPRRVETRTQ